MKGHMSNKLFVAMELDEESVAGKIAKAEKLAGELVHTLRKIVERIDCLSICIGLVKCFLVVLLKFLRAFL